MRTAWLGVYRRDSRYRLRRQNHTQRRFCQVCFPKNVSWILTFLADVPPSAGSHSSSEGSVAVGFDRNLKEQFVIGRGQLNRTPCHAHPALGVVDWSRFPSPKGRDGTVRPVPGCLCMAAPTVATSSVGEKGLAT